MTDRRLFSHAFCLVLLALTLSSCSGHDSGSTAIPRRQAYPRIQLYDTLYTDSGLPAGFETNSSATVIRDNSGKSDAGPVWIDISYPAYEATVSCTFTPLADDRSRQAVIDNRLERMSLNLGDRYAEQTEMMSDGGYSTIILDSKGTTVTPLQFLSAGRQWVISGAMYFNRESVNADSVRPAIDAVKNDIIHAAKRLR